MDTLEAELQEAVANNIFPFIVLAAASNDDSFNYFKYFGKTQTEDESPRVSADTMFHLASTTKLVTCVAAMQVVERGLVGLDQDISTILPEWKHAKILKGFSEGIDPQAILEDLKTPVTMRYLLSHTCGIVGLEDEQLTRYFKSIGDSRGTVFHRYFMDPDPAVKAKALPEVQDLLRDLHLEPLVYEPGTKWKYAQGVDWAGRVVEGVSRMTLEEYCQHNIFKPLGMKNTTFRPLSRSEGVANIAQMTTRGPDGKVTPIESIWPLDAKSDLGGVNLYSTGADYIKILSSLTRNDGKILRPETVDLMFNYRLPETESFRDFRTDADECQDQFGDMAPEGLEMDHCLAGLTNTKDLRGGRKADSITWAAATACFWWIDRQAGICGFQGSQVMLVSDKGVSRKYFRKFEKAIYEKVGRGY